VTSGTQIIKVQWGRTWQQNMHTLSYTGNK